MTPEQKLIRAIRQNKPHLVKKHIKAGANIHVNSDLPLRLAAWHGRIETVKLLIEIGADIHVLDDEPLRYAACYGYTEIVKLLIEAGADIHVDNDEPLRDAVDNGYTEIVQLLEETAEKEKQEYQAGLNKLKKFRARKLSFNRIMRY